MNEILRNFIRSHTIIAMCAYTIWIKSICTKATHFNRVRGFLIIHLKRPTFGVWWIASNLN